MLKKDQVEKWLEENRGVLVAKSAIVFRNTYFGNNIIAQNNSLKFADSRGYVPVELWIMSMVGAENTVRVEGEGMTTIRILDEDVSLFTLNTIAGSLIFGDYAKSWPLTKILDIGGTPTRTSFGTEEIPPIPVHVHPNKTEAYFFPPTNISPYNRYQKTRVHTRIGLKKGVTKEEFKERLVKFGRDDSMFELLNQFPIEPMTGWTVLEKTLHAPGPYVTFEIQRPADDYNNASWRLGERLDDKEQAEKYEEHVLRGVQNGDEYIDTVLNWSHTTDQTLRDKYFHTPKVLESGTWGKRYQIFFDMFYGEGWEILPHETLKIAPQKTPKAGIVWSGEGSLNGNKVSVGGMNEFLVVPDTELTATNTSDSPLFIYTTEPIRRS
jgi:hypothetical protein